MWRTIVLANGVAVVVAAILGNHARAEMVFTVDVSPLIVGAAKGLMGTNNRGNTRQYQPHRQHLVPQTSRFSGSYYVERGKHYFQPPRSPQGSRPQKIKRGGGEFVDDLSQGLTYEAKMLCLDMKDNYSRHDGFDETYRAAYHTWQLASQIAKGDESLDHTPLATMARELDPQFQPVRRGVAGWTRHHKRQRGTGDVQAKVERIETLIHHLLYDIGPPPKLPNVAKSDDAAQQKDLHVARAAEAAPPGKVERSALATPATAKNKSPRRRRSSASVTILLGRYPPFQPPIWQLGDQFKLARLPPTAGRFCCVINFS